MKVQNAIGFALCLAISAPVFAQRSTTGTPGSPGSPVPGSAAPTTPGNATMDGTTNPAADTIDTKSTNAKRRSTAKKKRNANGTYNTNTPSDSTSTPQNP